MPSLPENARRADVVSLVGAVCVALTAFALYRATLLPGFDFGDTGSLQTTVGSTLITPRVGYPLYFAIANIWVWLVGGDPARALNLASAVQAAFACGLGVLVAVELSGSIASAAGAILLFAVSYTFWSQSILAEVYALHTALLALTLLLLLRWTNHQTTTRLVLFFLVYAVGFGNHLSMVLLAPAYTIFVLLTAKDGWRSMLTPHVIALALLCAAIGASQYAWNLRALWYQWQPPAGGLDALHTFWFDVTKSDWRDTMVLQVPQTMLRDHAAMYWFDLRQQFGPVMPFVALAGLLELATRDPRRAILMATLFAANVAFAFTYNVGDAHVFYLPSHFILALLIAPGLALACRLTPKAVTPAAALAIGYAALRAYHDYPALDRGGDVRAAEAIGALTTGLDDQRTILLADLNWQIGNGLSYFAKVHRPGIAHAHMPDVLLYAPALVRDNDAIAREVALTERARSEIDRAYGPLLPTTVDPRVVVTPLSQRTAGLPDGTPYVLCLLKPSRDMTLDVDELSSAVRNLTGSMSPIPAGDYAIVAGQTGQPPAITFGSNLPFTRRVQLGGLSVDIRMESWLSADTIRRMGFGHVIAGRHHTLIVERGVSFAAFDGTGRAIRTAYAANIFASQPRYLIRKAGSPAP